MVHDHKTINHNKILYDNKNSYEKKKVSIITEYCTITKIATKKKGKTINNNRILYDNKNNYEKKGEKNYQK
jgi:hypothetical protein